MERISPTVRRILQKEKHIDEISYSGIRSGIFTGSALWRSYFLPHPIRGIGWLIAKTEKTLRAGNPQAIRPEREGRSADRETFWCDRFTVYGNACTALILFGAYAMHPGLGVVIEAVMTYQIPGGEVSSGGEQQGVETIERREPGGSQKSGIHDRRQGHGHLTEEGVAKAAIETVAENTSDGVIAPDAVYCTGRPGAWDFYIRQSIPWILW